MMQPTQAMELIWECERRYPVASWEVGGMHAWPLIRKNLAESLRAAHGEAGGKGQLRQAILGAYGQQRATALDGRHNAHLGPADVVFFSNASCRSLMEGQWLDRLCDPLREQLELRQHRCLHLELAAQNQYRIPRWKDSKLIQQAVLRQHLRNAIRPLHWDDGQVEIPGFEELLRYVKQGHFPEWDFSRDILLRNCSLLERLASVFTRILQVAEAQLVIVECFYGMTGLAAILAARRRKIVSLDVQHGVQGALHFAYGPWTACPAEGYTLLPDRFWCWTDADAKQINSWAGETAPRHGAFTGGNPWASYWSYSNPEGATQIGEQLEAVRARLGGTRQILVSLQWGANTSSSLPSEVSQCLAQAPEDWRWWIRFHPSDTPSKHSPPAWIAALPQSRSEWQAASTLPLPLLLPAMDAHLTGSSSVVQEAAAAGIPSVVTQATGLEYFRAGIAAGTVKYARQPGEIILALGELMHAKASRCGSTQAISWDVSLRRLSESTGLAL